MSKPKRSKINTPERLVAWRAKYGLLQIDACALFFRSRRGYQKVEAGILKTFPREIDQLCKLYEQNHKPVKGIRK